MTMRSRRGAGTLLLEAARERGAEAADAVMDAALADFAEELEAFSIGACVREGEAMGACGDEDASTSAVRISDATRARRGGGEAKQKSARARRKRAPSNAPPRVCARTAS